jgi:phosphatidylglycerophosphatase A
MKKITDKIKQTYHKQQAKTKGIDLSSVWHNPLHFVTCGFGLGLLPAPGTFGTLLGVVFYLLLHPLPLWAYLTIVAVLNIAGIFMCDKVNKDLNTDDHPAAVWDEVAAFPIVMIAVPFTWYWIVIGFILFRLIDIFKPGPIGWLDRHVHGGFGVMIDDVAAALVSLAIVQILMCIA